MIKPFHYKTFSDSFKELSLDLGEHFTYNVIMRIVIITQEDPFYMPIFFSYFFEELKKSGRNVDVAGVVIQDSLGKKSLIAFVKSMMDFYGLFHFILHSVKYLWIKAGKLLNEANLLPKSFSIEYFVRSNDCKILGYKNVNSPEFIKFIKEAGVDLIVSVAASQIFEKELLVTPRLGCINIHNAPIPDYRGMLPSFWQMYFGEEYSVLTIYKMSEKLDRGMVILQDKTRIEEGMTLDELIKITKRKSATALVKVLGMFKDGEVKYAMPSAGTGSYYSFPTKNDVKEFKKMGHRII